MGDSAIGGASRSAQVYSASGPDLGGISTSSLSTESLIALFTEMSGEANSEIKTKMKKARESAKTTRAISDISASVKDGKNLSRADRQGRVTQIADNVALAKKDPPVGPYAGADKSALDSALKEVEAIGKLGGEGGSPETVDAAAQKIDSVCEENRADSSVLQMELQDLNSKRMQLSQQFSNMIASINDSAKAIIQNTR